MSVVGSHVKQGAFREASNKVLSSVKILLAGQLGRFCQVCFDDL